MQIRDGSRDYKAIKEQPMQMKARYILLRFVVVLSFFLFFSFFFFFSFLSSSLSNHSGSRLFCPATTWQRPKRSRRCNICTGYPRGSTETGSPSVWAAVSCGRRTGTGAFTTRRNFPRIIRTTCSLAPALECLTLPFIIGWVESTNTRCLYYFCVNFDCTIFVHSYFLEYNLENFF